jgi:hypothetical protein
MVAMNPLSMAVPAGRKLTNFGFISGIIGEELKGDWKAVLKKTVASKQNIKHYFVEYDKVVDGMGCLKTSGKYLRNLIF